MTDLIRGDRRISKRYQFELGVRFRYFTADGVAHAGYGVTVDVSRKSILMRTEDPPPIDTVVELRIDWPILLQGVCPLEVLVKGHVLRTTGRGTIVENHSYEFRTRGERSFAENSDYPSTSMIA